MLGGMAEVVPLLNTAFKDMEALEITKLDLFSTSLERLVSTEIAAKANDSFGGRLQIIAGALFDSAGSFKEAGERISEIPFDNLNQLMDWFGANAEQLKSVAELDITSLLEAMETEAKEQIPGKNREIAVMMLESLASYETSIETVGKDFMQGFINGIKAKYTEIRQAGAEAGRIAIQAVREAINSHSPSKETLKLGNYFGEGFVKGITNWFGKTDSAASELAEQSIDSISNALDYIQQLLDGELVVSMTIRPVLDLTDVNNGAMAIDSMFTQRQAIMAQLDSNALNQSNEIAELINVSWQILKEIQTGRDIYLDGKVLAGSMNRRLGRMEGL